jgi:hypothetical protein
VILRPSTDKNSDKIKKDSKNNEDESALKPHLAAM